MCIPSNVRLLIKIKNIVTDDGPITRSERTQNVIRELNKNGGGGRGRCGTPISERSPHIHYDKQEDDIDYKTQVRCS